MRASAAIERSAGFQGRDGTDSRRHPADKQLLGEDAVRRLWAGVFRNASDAETKRKCLSVLERNFENALSMEGTLSVKNARAAGWYGVIISWAFHSGLKHGPQSPLLQFRSGEVIVIPNMVSGYLVAPLAYESLVHLGRDPAGYAFVGWSTHGPTLFEDGTPMEQKFYAPPSHLKFLKANTDKVAFTVDDCEDSGAARAALHENLEQIGFKRICSVSYDGRIHMPAP